MRAAQAHALHDRRLIASVIGLGTFTLALLRVHFLNDHYDRIVRGRQILVYGDRPFADFFDPGYFLTIYLSALGQAITGGGLLGEAIIASAAIGVSAALTFRLAESASGSRTIAAIAAVVTLIIPPRYYDYDKVLFYMAGLAACWRYVDRPSHARAVAAGLVTALAALFRYDNGLFLMAASLAAIAVRRWRDPAAMARETGFYLGAIGAGLLPALIFIASIADLPEALRQIAAYAAREGRRSELFGIPRLAFDASSIEYVLIVAAAPLALIRVALDHRWTRVVAPDVGASERSQTARIASAAVLSVCVSIFILRDPIAARLGAGAPPAALLWASLAAGRLRTRDPYGSRTRLPRAVAMAIAALIGLAALALLATQGHRVTGAPAALARRVSAVTSGLGPSPALSYFPDQAALAGLAEYLRACTAVHDRVLVTGFAPEVFFFAQRGFAGGMSIFLGEHWSSEQEQRQITAWLELQRAPIAVVQQASEEGFRRTYGLVAAYLDSHYRAAGVSRFGDPRGDAGAYRVLVINSLAASPPDARWSLPCPAAGLPSKPAGE